MKQKVNKFLKKPVVQLWIRQMLWAVLLLFIVIFGILKFLKVWTNHGEYVIVPDLTKMTLSEVKETLEKANLRYEVLDSTTYNPKFPKYSVISQAPEATERVKVDRKIYLTINPSGYRKVTVPKIIQTTRRSAEAMLKSVGLELGKVTYVNDIGKNMVLEIKYKNEKINPGDMLPKTSKVDLVCGNGISISNQISTSEEEQTENIHEDEIINFNDEPKL